MVIELIRTQTLSVEVCYFFGKVISGAQNLPHIVTLILF